MLDEARGARPLTSPLCNLLCGALLYCLRFTLACDSGGLDKRLQQQLGVRGSEQHCHLWRYHLLLSVGWLCYVEFRKQWTVHRELLAGPNVPSVIQLAYASTKL